MLCLFPASILLTSCSKDGDEDNSEYLEFIYNGEKVSYDYCKFYENRESSGQDVFFVGGHYLNTDNQITINWDQNITKPQAGKTYDITTNESGVPNISIIYQVFYTNSTIYTSNHSVNKGTKIGEVTITKLTDDRMNGSFSCKMSKGEITNGTFNAEFTKHWYHWVDMY
ncbi:hypothetical protein AGMMS50239_27060 [Bacteroidia bacterium]|nr:hypothetical protein AGMMS50239_27060 [Bacteroidia bacterium]